LLRYSEVGGLTQFRRLCRAAQEMMRLGCAKLRGGRALNSVVRWPTAGVSLTKQGGI